MIDGAPINVKDYGASPSASSATNTTAIQAALNAALSSGNALEFNQGTYSHDGLVYTGGNLKLIGKNTVLSYTGVSDAFLVRSANNTNASGLNVSGITFKNGLSCFKVLGQGTGIYSNISITNCKFDTSTSGMLWMEQCSNAIIDGNLFENAQDNGIYYSFSRDAVISNNIVRNCSGSGSITVGYSSVNVIAQNIIIEGNEIFTDSAAPVASIGYISGICAVYCQNVAINNNHISNGTTSIAGKQIKTGIILEEFTITNVTVQGNKISNMPEEGIRVGDNVNSLVSILKIVDNDIYQVRTHIDIARSFGVTIDGNTLRRSTQEAIQLQATAGAITVTNNVITDSSIQATFAAFSAIECFAYYVSIYNNTFIDSEFGGFINSTAATPTYSVAADGTLTLFQVGVAVATISTIGRTWELVKNDVNAVTNWQLSLYPTCNSYTVEYIRRTGHRWEDNVQQYNIANHLGTPEPYAYINVGSASSSVTIRGNKYSTKTLDLPNHHRNTTLYELQSDTLSDVGAIGAQRVFAASAAPTVGNWLRGDVVYDTAPSASGFVGFVCVASGAPGTWKTFGAISA
jgi:parallel beta-helix repeat protein